MFSCLLLSLVTILSCRRVLADVDPIVIKGSHFFYKSNGTEFFLRGVIYQDKGRLATQSTTIIDPLADGPTCARDIPVLQSLRTNVIRTYALDPTRDHSACMNALADAGIYIITDLSGGGAAQINRTSPAWDTTIYNYYTSVVDEMANYSNTLGFFVGNEVVGSATGEDGMVYVKAALRDIKAYIEDRNYRQIPVGYSATDYATRQVADYVNCDDASADMFGYNLYSWCGDSSFTTSGYDQETKQFQNYSIPVFLSEYGCNEPSPRNFTEVAAIYGDKMTGVWSGGIVYQYYNDDTDFGLVDVNGDTVSKLADYTALSTQMKSISASHTNMASYNPTNTQASCPSSISSWKAVETLPPKPYARLCTCMMESLSCIAKASVVDNYSPTQNSNLLDDICGSDDSLCAGVTHNGTTANYGAFSVCNATEQASWAANQYYLSKNNASSACNFKGVATTQSPTTDLNTDCKVFLEQAGAQGTGTITSIPSATGTAASPAGASGSATATSTGSPGLSISLDTSGLSAGAKAGIAVGVIALIGGLLGILYLLHRKKQQRKAAATGATMPLVAQDAGYLKPELDGQQVQWSSKPVAELDGDRSYVQEVEGAGNLVPPSELYGSAAAELPGHYDFSRTPGTQQTGR